MSAEMRSEAEAAALLMQHRTDLYAYLMAVLRDHHAVEDLLQEVSVAVIHSWGDYDPGTNFRAWAREIARRRMLHYVRTEGVRPSAADPAMLQQLEEAARAVESSQPVDERRAALQECFDLVRGPSREVLQLRYREECDIPETASRTGKTVQAIYAILKRLKIWLRQCVERRLSGSAGGTYDA